ncbi:MAG: MarR family transcriptional regulator [Solirubrobacteraceae bacterium]|nr:MarR family transcriptional regulator [Patulibacter sp.]
MPQRTDAPTPVDLPQLAGDLRMTVAALVRRFRQDRTVPQPQLAVLGRLTRKGPQTTSQLAAYEHVRPQSMAHTVAEMESAGFVRREPDPTDGRQTLIVLTDSGVAEMEAFSRKGESWVSAAIEEKIPVGEREDLARAVELLGRLVDED